MRSLLPSCWLAASGDAANAGFASQWGIHYPSMSPYATVVGGTRVNAVSWNQGAQSDVAWPFSTGGASLYAPMPDWQRAALGPSMIAANNSMRAVPDVAAVADYQHAPVAIYIHQFWLMGGGNSVSAPIWAGISALFGEYLTNKGSSLQAVVKATPGGFNGLLYQEKGVQGTGSGFYDIVSGNNNVTTSACSICNAGAGYDDVTGLGVPNVSQLFSNF